MASPTQFRRSRRDGSALPPVATIATITAIVLLAGAGTVLLAPGVLPLPWQRALGLAADEPALAAELPAGYVRVPLSATRIPAYAKVAREHLFDPKKVRWVETAVRRADLPSDVILDRGDALGRVLRQDKPAGYVFTERDFMPEGTRPGLVGGIPAGKRGYRVEVEKIPGLYGLNAGDRFDLLATLAVDDGALDDLERVGGA